MAFKRSLRRRATATAALVCAVATGSTLIAPTASAAPTVVAGTRFQTFEGWGTSLAWWSNVLGGAGNGADAGNRRGPSLRRPKR